MMKRIQTVKGSGGNRIAGPDPSTRASVYRFARTSIPDYARADPSAVVKVVQPYLEDALAAGVTALVECSTIGVGTKY